MHIAQTKWFQTESLWFSNSSLSASSCSSHIYVIEVTSDVNIFALWLFDSNSREKKSLSSLRSDKRSASWRRTQTSYDVILFYFLKILFRIYCWANIVMYIGTSHEKLMFNFNGIQGNKCAYDCHRDAMLGDDNNNTYLYESRANNVFGIRSWNYDCQYQLRHTNITAHKLRVCTPGDARPPFLPSSIEFSNQMR